MNEQGSKKKLAFGAAIVLIVSGLIAWALVATFRNQPSGFQESGFGEEPFAGFTAGETAEDEETVPEPAMEEAPAKPAATESKKPAAQKKQASPTGTKEPQAQESKPAE